MSDIGFLVDDEKDEFADLCKEYAEAINTESTYYLTLLPSLDCNLRCWYCFEKHIKGSHLFPETSEAIFNLVKRLFEENSRLSHLNVELFGGEPLLYFEEELFPLLMRMKEYVISIGKSVSFFFVTNAVCITEKNIPMFNEQCRNCKFLPLCWGPCCQKQLESSDKDFTRYCQKRNMEISIADYVRYRFNNAYYRS